MNKIILFCLINIFISTVGNTQCTVCYKLQDALIDPSTVRELNLSGEGLTNVPVEIATMLNLEELDLSNNQILEFSFPSGTFPKLRTLNLSNNLGFSTFSFDEKFLENCVLEELNLSSCGIRNINPKIGAVKELKTILLKNNQIYNVPNSLSDAKKISKIDLANNQLKRSRAIFANFWNLEVLDISGNDQLDLEVVFLSLLFKDKLHTLSVTPSGMKDILGESFNQLPIQVLTIKDATFENFDSQFKKNGTIKELNFVNCLFLKPSAIYGTLKSLSNLEKMDYNGTPVTKDIKELDQLKTLKIVNSPIEKDVELQDLKKLESLDLTESSMNKDLQEKLVEGVSTEIQQEVEVLLSENMISNKVEPIITPKKLVKEVKSEVESVIVAENSVYEIPKNAFLNANGSQYNGQVKIGITEYFNAFEIALAGAPMVIRSENKNQLFSSNGMINFEAIDDKGNELIANPSAPIQVTLNDMLPASNSNLYSFDKKTNNWIEIGKPTVISVDSLRTALLDSLDKVSNDKFVETVFVPVLISFSSNRNKLDDSEIILEPLGRYHFNRNNYTLNLTRFIYTPNEDQRLITNQIWKIDTILNPELVDKLKMIRKESRKLETRRRKRFKLFESIARPIQDVKIIPDFENDHFILSMSFKGELLQFPVYLGNGGNINGLMKKQSNFYKKYTRELKGEAKYRTKILKKEKKIIQEIANRERQRILKIKLFPSKPPSIYKSVNRGKLLAFKLITFGTVNCDGINTVEEIEPTNILALKNVMNDQNGIPFDVPNEARIVVPSQNTFLTVPVTKIPFYDEMKTIVFLRLNEKEIVVLKNSNEKDAENTYIAQRISIENKSDKEIIKLINK